VQAGADPGRGRGALARSGPVFAALVGLTALAILLQAVFAGEFVDRASIGSGWLHAHEVNGDVAEGLAVVTALFALVKLRAVARSLVIGSAVLAVAVIAQAEIGRAITDNGHDALLVIHIPLALAVFGLTIWLSVKARQLRHAAAA
jgi:hypothetical protein